MKRRQMSAHRMFCIHPTARIRAAAVPSTRQSAQGRRCSVCMLPTWISYSDILSEHGRSTVDAQSEHGRSTVGARSKHSRCTIGARSEHGRSTVEARSKQSQSTVGARSERGRSTTCLSQLTNVTDEPEWSHCIFLVCYEQEQFNHVAAKSF